MKNWLILLGTFFYLSQAIGQEKTLLFSIKGKDTKMSYIFGTVHMIEDTAFYFPTKLDKTLSKTDQLVLEIENVSDKEALLPLLILDSGSLFDHFSKEQGDSIVQWGAPLLGMKPETFRTNFEALKPFVLIQIGAQAMMSAHTRSYEMELTDKANANKQPIKGLESMESQLAIFDHFSDAVITEMIMSGIRNPEAAIESQKELTKLYMDKDMEGLAKLIVESEEIGENTEVLVYQRNRNWIPVMTEFMKTQSCFFAVGAGHLGGEQGVIQLLKNAGYTITPIAY